MVKKGPGLGEEDSGQIDDVGRRGVDAGRRESDNLGMDFEVIGTQKGMVSHGYPATTCGQQPGPGLGVPDLAAVEPVR